MALSGSLVLLFEFLNVRTGGAEGYHAPSIGFALLLIVIPAVFQPPWRSNHKTTRREPGLLQSTHLRNASYFALTVAWLLLAGGRRG